MKFPLLLRFCWTNILCLGMFVSSTFGGDVDSLRNELSKSKSKEQKIEILLALTEVDHSTLNESLNYAKQAYELSVQADNEKGKLRALSVESLIYYALSDVKNAMETALEAKGLAEKLNMQKELSILLDGLGLCYYDLGDKKKCAEFYFSSLKISEQLNRKSQISRTLSRIGVLYMDQKDYVNALDYFTRSLAITRELKDDEGVATNLNNLASVYNHKEEYDKSLYYLKEALVITKKIGNRNLEGSHYLNIGKVYYKMKKYNDAMRYYTQALGIFNKTGNHTKFAFCNLRIGEADIESKNYSPASENIIKALKIGKDNGLKDVIYQSYQLLHRLYLAKKDTNVAYNYSVLENQWKDSLALGEKEQNLTKMELQYHFDKKEQLDRAEQKRRSIFNLAIIISLSLGIIIILLILNQLRLRAKKSRLEKIGLEKELDFKKKELTLNVLSLMKKNEMLSDISKKIVSFEEAATHDETRSTLRSVRKELMKSTEEETLKEFSLRFKEVHKEFYDKLLQQFPDLTPSEIKLCAFLRLNMTSKEISELTGQRLNTLENARYRLRQKLGITNSETNLVSFLAQI